LLRVASELFCKDEDVKIEEFHISYNREFAFAPTVVIDKLKLRTKDGEFDTSILPKKLKLEDDTLTGLNDNGWSFKRIAKFIRDNPRAVFKS
jgi:hypothetical protein